MPKRVKNWRKFQVFHGRKPPWIKLYRDLLDDIEWHALDGDTAKTLVTLWLIASEYGGALPETKILSFRLRLPESTIEEHLSRLGHWILDGDSVPLSNGLRESVAEEIREETEQEPEADIPGKGKKEKPQNPRFAEFWKAYPRKTAKSDAEKAFRSLSPSDKTFAALMEGLEVFCESDDWCKEDGKFIPYPATWLRARRWEDFEDEDEEDDPDGESLLGRTAEAVPGKIRGPIRGVLDPLPEFPAQAMQEGASA